MRRLGVPLLCGVILFGSNSISAQTSRPKRKPTPAAAAAPANTREAYPLESVVIAGNHRYQSAAVIAALGLRVGDRVNKQDFEAARERLLATGDFDDVAYHYEPSSNFNGYAASFQVREVPEQYVIRYESLPLPPPDLDAALRQKDPLFTGSVSASPAAIARYTQFVRDILVEKGKTFPVISKVQPEAGGPTTLIFRPEGALPSVAEIHFRGNKVLSAKELQTAVGGTAIGSIYTETRMHEILDAAARPQYEAKGYLRVKFTKLETVPDTKVKGVDVTVDVVEGEPYKLSRLLVRGPVEDPDALRAEAKLKEGATVNFDEVRAGVNKMEASLRHSGFLAVTSTVEKRIDDAGHKVDVVVVIKPGARYEFGKLSIEGLDIISEPQIRKMWTMKPGGPFNPDYPDYFLTRVRADGVFDNLGKTSSDIKRDDENHIADVVLYFRGAEKPVKEKKHGLGGGPI